jgi:hypothetical protein
VLEHTLTHGRQHHAYCHVLRIEPCWRLLPSQHAAMEVPPDILTRRRAPFPVTRRAFQALPATVQEYYFRGCEKKLVKWLRDENRSDGHKGRITFGISVRMTASSRAHRSLGGKPLETISRGHGDDQRMHRCVELLAGRRRATGSGWHARRGWGCGI